MSTIVRDLRRGWKKTIRKAEASAVNIGQGMTHIGRKLQDAIIEPRDSISEDEVVPAPPVTRRISLHVGDEDDDADQSEYPAVGSSASQMLAYSKSRRWRKYRPDLEGPQGRVARVTEEGEEEGEDDDEHLDDSNGVEGGMPMLAKPSLVGSKPSALVMAPPAARQGVSFATPGPAPPPAPLRPVPNWWAGPAYSGDYLCVYIRDAKNLPIKDNDTQSASTYVKIRLNGDAEGGTVKALEAQTRVVHHIRDPFFGQAFFFPLANLTPASLIHISVLNPGVLDRFCGQILTTMEYLLAACDGPMDPLIQWYGLEKRRSSDRIGGELCMLLSVVPRHIYNVVQWSESPETLLDPQMLKALLQPYSLRIQFDSVREFKFPLDLTGLDTVDGLLSRLSIQVRLGRSIQNRRVVAKDIVKTMEASKHGKTLSVVTFKIDDALTFSLDEAFSVAFNRMTKRRQRDEIGDLRVYLMDGKQAICKTQVPIWDIPVHREKAGGGPLDKPSTMSSSPDPDPASFTVNDSLTAIASTVMTHRPISLLGTFDLWVQGLAEQSNLRTSKDQSGRGGGGAGGETLAPGGASGNLAPSGHSGNFATAAEAKPDSSSKGKQARPPSSTTVDVSASSGSAKAPSAPLPTVPSAAVMELPALTGLAIIRNIIRPLAGPKGVTYKRRCEVYSPDLEPVPLEITFSAVLLLTKDLHQQARDADRGNHPAGDNCDDDALSSDGEEDGTLAPTPIDMPPPLPVMVSEAMVGLRPMQLCEKIFSPDSDFRTKMTNKEVLVDVVTGDWEADPNSAGGKVKVRTVTYTRPISIPLPMSPKKCDVTEIHTMLIRESGGFVLEAKVSTNAPKGDTFFVLIQWAAAAGGASKSRLRVSFKVEFVKSVGFLKGAIEGGALSSTKKLLQAWVDELVHDFGKGDRLDSFSAPSRATIPSTMALPLETAPPLAVDTDRSDSRQRQAARSQLEWKDAVGLLLLALLILSIFQIGRGLFSIGQGIQEVAKAMSEVAAALASGGGGGTRIEGAQVLRMDT